MYTRTFRNVLFGMPVVASSELSPHAISVHIRKEVRERPVPSEIISRAFLADCLVRGVLVSNITVC